MKVFTERMEAGLVTTIGTILFLLMMVGLVLR
jgi:hypothetical protein